MNICIFSGNIVADAQKHTSKTDRTFYTFTIANNSKYYNKDKSLVEKTLFVDIVVSRDGHKAYVEKYAKKGTYANIGGKLDIYESEKDGKKYKNLRILVDDIHLSINGEAVKKDSTDTENLPF
jgi:single-stranded DNA-binding protein